ncbi:MAG: EAL domain-containing protein [Hamadaea sp.]|uniref:EAL domain-containing protein n=1 Tax=Hamadaea sp. TaxID=2024425 RepID=UPI0017EBB033|nr:EAL domain-containing protein [Hamadaea sp.]NUR74095.1 EAL domain-containing protein [Hamadaea sp.]NUT20239.1 EAL domain-containing protein [Hamadaea sp.]
MSTELTLGVLSPYLGGWYFGGIMAGIARAGRELGANVLAMQTSEAGTEQTEIERPPDLRHLVGADHIAGVVVILRAAGSAYLKSVQESGRPVVAVGYEVTDLDCPVVVPDNRAGVRASVDHLIGHGHQRIAFAGFLGATDVRERLEAYREALIAHGIDFDPALVFEAGDNHEGGGEAAGRQMVAAGIPSTALITGTDANAVGIMTILQAEGLVLPQDQAIIGFDDQRVAAYADPPLTTVRQPVQLLGRTAVAELARLLHGSGEPTAHHHVPTALVVRESCGCVPGPASSTVAEQLRAAVAPVPPEVPSAAVDRDVAAVADAIGPAPAPGLSAALQRLAQASGRPEILMDMVTTVSEQDSPAGPLMRAMMQAHGRAEFLDNVYLQKTLSQQYEVSTGLLRGHRDDPRGLGWLARTPAQAGCLGLWTGTGTTLEVAGAYLKDGIAPEVPTRLDVTAFPPAYLLDVAGRLPEGIVFVVPVKVDASDWGLLAVADTAVRAVETGREPVNHWAALLSHTLDYDRMVRDLRLGKEQLRAAALYDGLTGLPNRTLFLDRLRQAIRQRRRTPGRQFAVLFLDVDGFKVVNDSLGHGAGDGLLVEVAARINENLRASDTAARFGGDEFLILLDDIAENTDANEVAQRLQTSLAEPFHVQGHDVVVTASIGVTFGDSSAATAEDLVRDADIAMYTAKSRLKGSQAVFDDSMRTKAVRRLQVESELRRALERHEIQTFVQPIVHLPTGRIDGFEALARWEHPTRGLLDPAGFLPIAEETGLVIGIGQQILADVCRRLAGWREAAGRDLRVSVNVSHRQLWTRTLLGTLTECILASGIDGGWLALELTESVVMRDVSQARTFLEEIHALGCELYIDDFGTGYSSLEALHRLPIDALKIDKSFVSRLGQDVKSGDLVDSIILMGHKLGLRLIAEGVETTEQRDHLVRLGCAYGQGHLFAEPVPADEAEDRFLR